MPGTQAKWNGNDGPKFEEKNHPYQAWEVG